MIQAKALAPSTRVDRRFALITVVILGVILYGSLYPFRYSPRPDGPGAIATLFSSWDDLGGRGDAVANVLLYLPLGFFGVQSFRRGKALAKILWMTAAGVALSTAVELSQYYDFARVTNISDVYTNGAGTLIGATGGVLLKRGMRLPVIGHIERRPFAALLVASWAGFRVIPYLFNPNLGESWARRLLILDSRISFLDLYVQFAIALVVALLLQALVGVDRGRWALLWVLPALLFTRTMLAGRGPTAAEALGAALAMVVWPGILWKLPSRSVIIAGLFIGVVVAQGLAPYTFQSIPRRFSIIPFRSFIYDTRENAIRSFFEKTFTYGALIWLLVRAGSSWAGAAAAGGVLVLSLRLAQTYLPGRTAEITDVVMLLILAAVMRLMRENVPQD